MDIYSDEAGQTGKPETGSALDRFVAGRLRHALNDLHDAHLIVQLPSGYRVSCGNVKAAAFAEWRIGRWNALLRLGASGALGFAEGYIHDEWDTPDLRAPARRAGRAPLTASTSPKPRVDQAG